MGEKTGEDGFNWSVLYGFRQSVRRSYPTVYKLKIKKKFPKVVLDELKGNESVLEVGASKRDMAERVIGIFPSVVYKTMDIDRANEHDYYSLDEVDMKFDVIVMAEVIEHLHFNEGIELLKQLKGLLKPSGKVIITTPNIHHANRYWWDPDHKVPYRYDALGAILLYVGFEMDSLYRIYNDSLPRRIARFLLFPVVKLLDLDYARSIVAVAYNQG